MVEVDVEARGTRRTSRKMRWWQRTKRHGSRRDTGVKGREGGGERERGRARRGRRWTKKKKRRKKKKRTKKKRMKKKKGADPAAIYTRSGADRGKTPQFCSVRFCKLIFRRATIFCRARGGPSEKERRGKERRGSRIRARSLSLSVSLSHTRRTPRFLVPRERATKWQLSLPLPVCAPLFLPASRVSFRPPPTPLCRG